MAGQQRRDDEPDPDRFGCKASCAEVLVEQWARCWWGRMVKVAANRLKDRDAAEDIAQEAFMRALSIARSDPSAVETVRDPCCWLVSIARKLASGLLRTEGRRRRLRRENATEIRGQLFPQSDAGTEEDSRLKRVLKTAMQVLTKRQLQVLRLARAGLEDEEIAAELGLTRVTVRRHRMDAIRMLRAHMFRGGE